MHALKFEVGGIVAKLQADGDRICQSVLSGKPFESRTLELWAGWCCEGGQVLDVGGYTGLFSIIGRLRGAKVLAFEPMPFNRERFISNCALNGVSDEVKAVAVSDKNGTAVLHYNPIPFTSGASLVRRTGSELSVRTITIDSLMLTRLDAVKIDVERAEAAVLRGAVRTLRKFRPKLIVEVLDEKREREVKDVLVPLGYKRTARMDERNWIMEHVA